MACGVIGLQEPPKQSSSGSATKGMEAEQNPDEKVADWQQRYSREEIIETAKSIAYTTAVSGVSLAVGFYLAPKLFGKKKVNE